MSKESLDVNSNRFIKNVKYYIERYWIENIPANENGLKWIENFNPF